MGWKDMQINYAHNVLGFLNTCIQIRYACFIHQNTGIKVTEKINQENNKCMSVTQTGELSFN